MGPTTWFLGINIKVWGEKDSGKFFDNLLIRFLYTSLGNNTRFHAHLNKIGPVGYASTQQKQ